MDHYETLQISANAEPETIHRVYRLLAQRFHPDNAETGNADKFRQLAEAYEVAERSRAAREVRRRASTVLARSLEGGGVHQRRRRGFSREQIARLTVLELLYTRRRTEPQKPTMTILDVEALTGRAREHLEFSIWFLTQKKFITRGDDSALMITADGVEYLENNVDGTLQSRLLRAKNE